VFKATQHLCTGVAQCHCTHLKARITRKAQLMQWEMCNSGACLKARCKQNLTSPILATMFLLYLLEGARQPVSRSRIGLKSQIFPTLFSFSTLARSDPFQIYGKALRILKLSSRQSMVKIWWS